MIAAVVHTVVDDIVCRIGYDTVMTQELSEVTVQLTNDVAELPERLLPFREEMLANVVLLSQIPAPTGAEEERTQYILDRFVEAGVPEASRDEFGNAVATVPGTTGDRKIMVVAHVDTLVPADEDHNVTVSADHLIGPGMSDNSLGAAVICMLPAMLDHLGIRLQSDLRLVGSVRSLERANHAGLRMHMDHMAAAGLQSQDVVADPQSANLPAERIEAGICIEGINQGRLNYFSIGTIRGDITCNVIPSVHSRSYGSESAVVVLNNIINRMLKIEVPQRPFTKISINRVRAGTSYDVEPVHAKLSFEVNSHDDDMIERVEREIGDIVMENGSRHAVTAELDVFFRRRAGGLRFSHPLVRSAHEVMLALGIEPDQGHSPSELSEFISRGIPALTLGISRGEKHRTEPDYVEIEPIIRGVAQLIGTLMAIDAGVSEPE